MLDQLHPELEEFLKAIGEASRCLADMHASEGAAGNISLYIGWPVEVRRRLPVAELTALAQPVPELAGHSFIISLKLENLIQEIRRNKRDTKGKRRFSACE